MLTPEQLSELKETTPAFKSTPPELEQRLLRHGDFLTVPAGTRLFEEGDPCEAMLFVTRGSVRAVKISEEGREILLYRIAPGEFCVLTVGCLMKTRPYPAAGVTDTDVSGVRLPGKLFDELVQHNPAFRDAVMHLMGDRLADVMELVESVAFHRLDRRVARLLIEKSDGATNGSLEVTHHELAKDLGSSREIVSRVLESFEADGILALGRKRIDIRDATRLSRISLPPA